MSILGLLLRGTRFIHGEFLFNFFRRDKICVPLLFIGACICFLWVPTSYDILIFNVLR